jgi:hypothetical protein
MRAYPKIGLAQVALRRGQRLQDSGHQPPMLGRLLDEHRRSTASY